MTTGRGDSAASDAGSGFAQDWQALRSYADIQFAPLKPPQQAEHPEWFQALLEFLGDIFGPLTHAFNALGRLIGLSGQALTWLLIGVGAAILGYLAWRLTEPLRRRRSNPPPEAAEWQPDTEAALALLEDADRLAALGRYEEATHLLLRRSVEHIAEARPGLLEPSTTAREIAGLPGLPDRARRAFRVIADRVERSLFALRGLSAEDWQQARAAYAEFALAMPAA